MHVAGATAAAPADAYAANWPALDQQQQRSLDQRTPHNVRAPVAPGPTPAFAPSTAHKPAPIAQETRRHQQHLPPDRSWGRDVVGGVDAPATATTAAAPSPATNPACDKELHSTPVLLAAAGVLDSANRAGPGARALKDPTARSGLSLSTSTGPPSLSSAEVDLKPFPSPSSTLSPSPRSAASRPTHHRTLSHPLFSSSSGSELGAMVHLSSSPPSPSSEITSRGPSPSSHLISPSRLDQAKPPMQSAHHGASSSRNPVSTSSKPWSQQIRSVMDAIQEDFPRTPSLLQEDFPRLPGQAKDLTPNAGSSTRMPSMSVDAASMSQLMANLEMGRAMDDVAVPSSRRSSTGSSGGGHRRSASINWTGDTSFFMNAAAAASPMTDSSNGTNVGASSSSTPIRGRPGPPLRPSELPKSPPEMYNTNPVQPVKPPRSQSPPATGSSLQGSVCVPGHPPLTAPVAFGRTIVGQASTPTENYSYQESIPDLSGYDYLYGGNGNVALGPSTGIPDDMSIPGAGNTYSLPLSAYSAAFPSGGIGLPTLSGLPSAGPSAYNEPSNVAAFRDGLAAADSLKTMSIQMAAFLNAQQQLYAAQMAQIAAMRNTGSGVPGFGLGAAGPSGNSRQNSRAGKNVSDTPRGTARKGASASNNASVGRGGRRGPRSQDDLAADPVHIRSPLLEEFRSSSIAAGGFSRDWQLLDIQEHVVEFATDQHGSRFIQQRLETATAQEIESVLTNAMMEAHRLITDVFGNYVVQKLLEYGGGNAVSAIARKLEGRMLSLSLHMYGCRVVQKALEVLEPIARAKLVRELDGHVPKCIHDQNANHVVQKCIEVVEPENMQFIVDAVQNQAVILAGHSYGCRVVQRLLEHGSSEQKAPIMTEIMDSIAILIKDTFANYVVQHVVEHGTRAERSFIIEFVRADVCQLSQHKFASNVVERCLQYGSVSEREVLIEILIGEHVSVSPLNDLVRDSFGNYVVQRILDVARPAQRERVVNILKLQVPTIKKYSYGKHIIARLGEEALASGTSASSMGLGISHVPVSQPGVSQSRLAEQGYHHF